MTFTKQFKEDLKQEFMRGSLVKQLKQQGERHKALIIAKNLLKQNIPWSVIQSATGLSEQELALEKT
jgi:hypothetical protein